MSGGHFDYQYYHLDYIAEDIDEYINGHELDVDDVERYIRDNELEDWEKDYIRKHNHTVPNYYGYKDEVLEKMKEGLAVIRNAYIYAKSIDYLISGDYCEESFLRSLETDLKTTEKTN